MFNRGKYRLAVILRYCVGLPVRTVSTVDLELFPPSSADAWTMSTMDSGTALHKAMARFLAPGTSFVDVGANIGLFSILAAKRFGARVLAFEPSTREIARLKRNMRLNGVSIELFAIALGDVEGEASLNTEPAANHMMNTLGAAASENSSHQKCRVARFDTLFSDADLLAISLVKIDVEGYEMQVLRGMGSALMRMSSAAFVVEITPTWLQKNGATVEELYSHMERNGFRAEIGIRDAFQWDEIFVCEVSAGRKKYESPGFLR